MKLKHLIGGMGLLSLATVGVAVAQTPDEDVAFAEALWAEMEAANLVGDNLIGAVPYPREGQAHGATLVTLVQDLTVDGVTGQVIVKRSYDDDATREGIIGNPGENLANVTVMFEREGYAPDAGDWFWAMYMPTGMVGMFEETSMAGQVEGCTGCHSEAPNGNYTFLF
ncbi:MAG: cytochrome P460 family protein [Alphaproteobacteria bacterium]